MAQDARAALIEGLSDATGFVLGALAGFGLARLFGFDPLVRGEWTLNATIGLAFVLLGCGAGKWAVNRWRAARRSKP
jgi:hypothetical protein